MNQANYSSEDKEEDNDNEVTLTPMSEDIIYDNSIYDYGIDKKLIPIGHPVPCIGSHYNCHGWALGYKEWINIIHKKTDNISLNDQIEISCKEKGITEEDIFTDQIVTYARSETKQLVITDNNGCVEGAIAAYYKDQNLTHTARYKKSSVDDNTLTWSSKLGDGHVVEHETVEDLMPIYGDIIDFYNLT